MAGLTRIGYEDIYNSAKKIFDNADSNLVRAEAKKIATLVERCVGQMDRQPAETWIVYKK